MHPTKRLVSLLALVLLVVLPVACGAPAEEPAEPEPAQTEPEPEPEPVVVEPEPEPEPAEPAQPQLEGNIIVSDDSFEWIAAGTRERPATYGWTVTVRNDTTQTLDITVSFQFLDENDGVIKTERASVRLAPADSSVINEQGEMSREDSNRVLGYSYDYDWAIVGS